MVARLPQINARATIAPISLPNVTVAKDDPVSAILAKQYGDMTSRLNALGASVHKMALKQGETAGLAQGAASATALIKEAEKIGEGVDSITVADLPGDPSAISIIEQSARRGALAVITSQYAVEGRKAITAAALEAAENPDMTPADFGGKLNDIVRERTAALANISPVEAAKMGATLSIVANSTGVSQARSFFIQQKNIRKAKALADIPSYEATIKAIISGHVINEDGIPPKGDPESIEAAPSLQRKIDLELTNLRLHLHQEGVPDSVVATRVKAVKAAIVGQKIAVIKNRVRTKDEPIVQLTGVISRLEKKKKLDDPNIQVIVESLDVVGKNKLIDDLRSEKIAIIESHAAGERHVEKVRETETFNFTGDFLANLITNRPKAKEIIEQLKKINPEAAETLLSVYNEGEKPDTINNPRILFHRREMADQRKSVKVLYNEILVDKELSGGEKLDLVTKLKTFQEDKYATALIVAKNKISINPSAVRDKGDQASAERRRLLAIYDKLHGEIALKMQDPAFDPVLFVQEQLPIIEKSETMLLLVAEQQTMNNRMNNMGDEGMPGRDQFDLNTRPGLEALAKVLRTHKKNNTFNIEGLNRLLRHVDDAMTHVDAITRINSLVEKE